MRVDSGQDDPLKARVGRMVLALLIGSALLIQQADISVAAGPREPASAGTRPVVSDISSASFSVSWVTSSPSKGSIQVRIGKKWVSVSDLRGNVRSRTHLFTASCAGLKRCSHALTPTTTYQVRVLGDGARTTLHVRTAPILSPFRPLAAIGGKVQNTHHRPVPGALVYAIVHHAGHSSVPLATLTNAGGGWLFALPNTVSHTGAAFPLVAGERVSVQILTGTGSHSLTARLSSTDRPILLKPVVVP